MTNKLHLSDVIDYEKDIKPFRFIEIHAGPGAGKNTFIESLAKGEFPNTPKMRVLLITSRRAKVDETFSMYEDFDNENLSLFKQKIGEAWDIVDDKGNHTFATIGNTICTSAFIAGYMKSVFRADDRRTYLWDMYDVIAIDEVHSMTLDATYQDAPFYIYDFLNHYLDRCINEEYEKPVCKHVILMTGTPEPLQNYFPVREIPQNCLDLMRQCENIQPENIRFIESKNAVEHLQKTIEADKRCIYFGNRIDRIKEIFYDKKLPKSKMVLSFSDEEKRKIFEQTDNDAYLNMVETEEEIKDNYRVPKKFSVLLTTSRYREGINIKDDIDEMIIETHNKSDAIQMAGRVRSGVKDLYIVVDALPYPTDYIEEDMEQKLAKIQLWGSTNPTDPVIKDANGNTDKRCYPLNYMLNEIPEDQLQKFIDLLKDKFPYVRYSYLYACFRYYVPRITGLDYIKRENAIWKTGVKTKSIQQIVSDWFPDAKVHAYKSNREQKYEASWKLWKKYGFKLGEIYDKQMVDAFKDELSVLWEHKQLNKLMRMFSHYECVRAGKNKKSMKFREIQ